MKGNLVIIHGGGPTAVLNCSLYGAVTEALDSGEVDRVYGAVGGTGGFLQGNLLEFNTVAREELEKLKRTPATAIGTSRDALEAWIVNVVENVGGRLKLRYEGLEDSDKFDQWIFYLDPFLHQVGWATQNGYNLQPPLGTSKLMSFT